MPCPSLLTILMGTLRFAHPTKNGGIMAFAYTAETPRTFESLGELKSHVINSEKSVTQIPLEELIAEDAHFFADSRFGTSNHNYGFTEYSFKALCQYFTLPTSVVEGMTQKRA